MSDDKKPLEIWSLLGSGITHGEPESLTETRLAFYCAGLGRIDNKGEPIKQLVPKKDYDALQSDHDEEKRDLLKAHQEQMRCANIEINKLQSELEACRKERDGLRDFAKTIPDKLGARCAHNCFYEGLHPSCQQDPCNSYKICKTAEALTKGGV